ncbi:MAG: phosphotransferase [Verrucomicrobia bacterium]|nr:phosphotransferase [Verrucomicrobiota bacterium]
MTSDLSAIEALTREAFSLPANSKLTADELIKGGSGRRFYRVTRPDEAWSVIAMHYTMERPENARFESATHFLASNAVNVPNILAKRPKSHLLWLSDLGSHDLWSTRKKNWSKTQAPLYRSALKQVFKIHTTPVADNPELPSLEPPFDAALYQWEQDYFFKEFALRFSDCPETEIETLSQSPEAGALVDELSKQARQLIHRDFQSQNIMILNNEAWLIDYQGMRLGLPEYDVASLLFDPYVSLTGEQRDELIDFYFSLKQETGHTETIDTFRRRLFLCATQRLMQALGAYGFLGISKEKTSFLQHIPAALEALREVAITHKTFPSLGSILSLKK